MFKSLRIRLTILFVLLASLVYLALTAYGIWSLHENLTTALDDELQILLAEISSGTNISGEIPVIRRWEKQALDEPFERSATIQLFDRTGKQIAEYGLPGIPRLLMGQSELTENGKSMRIASRELKEDNQLKGYLQVQLRTDQRDKAMKHFRIFALKIMAPLLLIALAFAGYFFAGKAVKPVEHAYRVLRQFMSDAGHELATPVSIIQLNSEALEDDLSEHSLHPERLAVITRANERMGNIVSDLSLLSKMESPELNLKKEHIDLNDLVSEVVGEFQILFKEKQVALKEEYIDQVSISGDILSLKRLLSNLLQNALRYTDAGGQTVVGLKHKADKAVLTVADTGIGISPQHLTHIFERFYRVDEARARSAGGSGLGLAIVKAIAEAHHGDIKIDSEPGKGTTFAVTFPSN